MSVFESAAAEAAWDPFISFAETDHRATFAENLERWGDNIALVDEAGRTLSYKHLAMAADDFALRMEGRPGFLLMEAEATFQKHNRVLRCSQKPSCGLARRCERDRQFRRALADIQARLDVPAVRCESGA